MGPGRLSHACSGVVLWFKHCLLVIVTVGLETSVTLEVIFMIANIQTLGIPVRYSSLPGTISAALGIILIPTFGFVMDRWARSKSAKALILTGTCSLEILGNLFIFIANTIKLVYYDDPEMNYGPSSSSLNITDPWILTQATSSSGINSSIEQQFSRTPLNNMSYSVDNINTTKNSFVSSTLAPPGEETVRYYAILAMIGYCFLDCGYDSSNCFLKTFALASTEPRYHSSIIVKAVFVSSFGGCLVAMLGAVGLGGLLTASTHHDGSAAQTAFVAGLCLVILVSGLATSLTTGFCCTLSDLSGLDDVSESEVSKPQNEKSPLMLSLSHDLTSSERLLRISQGSSSKNFLEKTLSGRLSASNETPHIEADGIVDQVTLTTRTGCLGFLIRHKKQILVCLLAFCMLGSLYSFEVYAVNFVGDGIYKGDPLAPVNSEEYQKYLQGIEVGSQGTLIYYVIFTVGTSIHEIALNRLGWKKEMLVASVVYVILNLVCALTFSLWAYYVTAVWTGIFRTVVMTIPYILANRFALEEGGRDAGVAIATTSAMLPCGFSVCSALMGPLIDATGNAATPLYYTAATGTLGIVVTLFLKTED